MEAPSTSSPVSLGRNGGLATLAHVFVQVLRVSTCYRSGGTPGLYPAPRRGALLLVLLSGSTGILSLCQELSRGLDESGTGREAPGPIKEAL